MMPGAILIANQRCLNGYFQIKTAMMRRFQTFTMIAAYTDKEE